MRCDPRFQRLALLGHEPLVVARHDLHSLLWSHTIRVLVARRYAPDHTFSPFLYDCVIRVPILESVNASNPVVAGSRVLISETYGPVQKSYADQITQSRENVQKLAF